MGLLREWRGGLAECLQRRPNILRGIVGTRGDFLAPSLAATSFPNLPLLLVWAAARRRDEFQQVQQVGRGPGSTSLPVSDLAVL